METAKANEVRDNPEYKKLETEIKFFNRFAWALVFVGAISLAIISGKLIFGNPGWAQTLGDFTGGVVASFWSLAGIMFVYIAFLGQKQQLMLQEEELRLNREEMIATRKEIEGQRMQLEEQSKTATLQRFENTFFNLVQSLMQSINTTYITRENREDRGLATFTYIRETLNDYYYNELNINAQKGDLALINAAFNNAYTDTKKDFKGGNVISLLNEVSLVFEFVENSNLSGSTKKIYLRILLNKLGNDLLLLVIYRGLSAKGNREKILGLLIPHITDIRGSSWGHILIEKTHKALFEKYEVKEE